MTVGSHAATARECAALGGRLGTARDDTAQLARLVTVLLSAVTRSESL